MVERIESPPRLRRSGHPRAQIKSGPRLSDGRGGHALKVGKMKNKKGLAVFEGAICPSWPQSAGGVVFDKLVLMRPIYLP